MRKNVSWRVSENDHPRAVEINKWLNAQNNIQISLNNIVLHLIEKFGYKDVTDYEVQKALFLAFSEKAPVLGVTPADLLVADNFTGAEKDSENEKTIKLVTSNEVPEDDDTYSEIDPGNF